jgi:hypothetical protein
MINTLNIRDLEGLVSITRKGANSQIRFGEVATFRPFEAPLSGDFNSRMKINVSELNYKKAARKQDNNSTMVNSTTLLKHINPMMFLSSGNNSTVEEITGKKVEWKGGKPKYPATTIEEDLWINIAEWAYSSFGTLRGVSCLVSLQNGEKLFKKF